MDMNIFLWVGVLLFCLIHLFSAACTAPREAIKAKIGEGPYKGLFSLLILLAIGLIIYGWRTGNSSPVYMPPNWGPLAPTILMYPVLFLFIAASTKSRVKQFIRHPQLTAIFLWAVAHLLANGDSHSLCLFGIFAVWTLLEIYFLNRRDGPWQKPAKPPLSADIKIAALALVLYIVLAIGHEKFTGIPLS